MTKYSEWGMLDEDIPLPIPNDYNPKPFSDHKEIPAPIHEDEDEPEPVLISTSNDIKITTVEDIVDETDRNIGAFVILFICVFFLVILLTLR